LRRQGCRLRARLARTRVAGQRFFENGERPTGLASEAVIQSWSRCLQLHQSPERRPEFNPVTASRVHAVLNRNRLLLQAAESEWQRLQHLLAGTSAVGFLVDAQGVAMHTTWPHPKPDERVMPSAARVGVNLGEDRFGTNAPGLAARTGGACTVMGDEHVAQSINGMHGAAAPVHDNQGRLAAVLDLTREGRPFGFDAAAVVGL
jgi:sigma-54 dependent transcriptional regulator, acetoin dehydrogenase operon transcriptional activator AcoR